MFARAASNMASLALRATIIEDTHLTLEGIPFKVEANSSLIFLPLQTYEKKICRVSVPVHIYNSLIRWSVYIKLMSIFGHVRVPL